MYTRSQSSSRPRRPFQSGGFKGPRRGGFGASRPRRSAPRRDDRSEGGEGEGRGSEERRAPRFRAEGDRPYRARGTEGGREDRPFGDRPRSGGFGSRGPRRSSGGFGSRGPRRDSQGFGDRPAFGDRPRSGGFSDRPRRSFGERPRRPFNDRPRDGGFGDRPRRDRDDERQPFADYRSKPYARDFERDKKAGTQDTSWEVVADWYDQMLETDEDSYQAQVVAPNLLRLMNIQYNDRIVDLGCGQGFFARKFAEAGAKVTGVDASADLITKAQEKAHPESRFLTAPAQETTLPDGCAETVTIVLALQNMEDMHAVFKEAARVLTPRGKLYIVLNHPAFRIPQHSDWIFDPATDTQSRRVSQYLSDAKIKIDMTPGQKEHKKFTWSFHHPLQSYMKHLYNAGFVTCRMEEWSSHKESERGPRKKAEDAARKEIPLFLCIEARKQSVA